MLGKMNRIEHYISNTKWTINAYLIIPTQMQLMPIKYTQSNE